MQKVLFTINTLGLAGAEIALLPMLEAFHEIGFEVHLLPLIPQGEVSKRIPEYVKIKGPPLNASSVLSFKGRLNLYRRTCFALLRYGFKRRRYLIEYYKCQRKNENINYSTMLWCVLSDATEKLTDEYDLAIGYLEGGATHYVVDYVKAKTKVCFVHADIVKMGYVPALEQAYYDKIEQIFCVSDAVKESLKHDFKNLDTRLDTFRNIVSEPSINLLADKPCETLACDDGKILLTVGRLVPQKAYELSIKAAAIVKQNGYAFRWYVIGDGPEKKQLKTLIKQYNLEDTFILLGAKENPLPLVKQCDIYLQTSRAEGWGLALNEARILHKPSIITDCGAMLEQVQDGVNGIVVKLEPEDIARGIQFLLDNPEECERYKQYLEQTDFAQETDMHKILRHVNGGGDSAERYISTDTGL